MRLDKLRLMRAPGIRTGFTLEPLPGLNLITGPNGIGKSSICRAISALLWPGTHGVETLEVEAEFTSDGRKVTVSRQDLNDPIWQGARPDLGPEHLAGRYELGVLELLRADRGDDPLAREIRRHVAGGFDLEQIRSQLFDLNRGRSESRDLRDAKTTVARLQADQNSLGDDQNRLLDLEASFEVARRAKDRKRVLEALRDLTERQGAREDALLHLENIPAGVAHVRDEDPEKLAKLRKQERELLGEIEDRTAALEKAETELAWLNDSGLDPEGLPFELLKKKLPALVSLERDIETADVEAQTFHQDEVLAKASVKPRWWPSVIALIVGCGLIYTGVMGLLPWPIPMWILAVLGGGFVFAGISGVANYARGRKTSRLAMEKQQEMAAKKDRLAAFEKQWTEALVGFNAELEKSGIPTVSDATEADHRIEELRNHHQKLVALRKDKERDTKLLAREQEHLDRVGGEIQEIFDRLQVDAGPHADAEVSPLLELKPAYEKAVRNQRDADQDIARLEKEVSAGRELLASDETAATSAGLLTGLIEREEERADELEGIQKEITRIKLELDRAFEGQDLQNALVKVGTAHYRLEDVRQSNREATLGRLLLDRVEDQHEKESRPEVLEKADEYFQLFTGGRYELEMKTSPEGIGRFLALPENSVQRLELDQLSDGTRTQLLLAVKLAFITAGEKGARPPIFLDDSLSSADPERFAAVADSLGRLAEKQDRQIFYLTPNPADAAAFHRALAQANRNPAHHIDLGALRDQSLAVDAALLDPANLPTNLMAPDPTGMTVPAYAEAASIPRPDPWAPSGAIHVFYLLEDNLNLVRRMIDARAPSLNRFEKREATILTAGLVTPEEAGTIRARGKLWEAWLDGWRIGRARPVTREFLKTSDGVSEKSLVKVLPALEECNWDGALLLEAIDSKKVKGFLTRKRDQLQQELKDAGLLAHGSPLTDPELADFIDDRLKDLLAANLLDVQKVRTLALTFAQIIEK